MPLMLGLGLSLSGGGGATGDAPLAPLQTPVLIESFDAANGTASGGGTATLDTSNKIQGTGSVILEGSGVSGQNPIYTRTATLVDDMSTWDVIAWWERHGDYPHASQTFWQFGRSGTYNTAQPSFSMVNGNFGKGQWRAVNVSEFTGSPVGSGQIDRRFRVTQQAPYNNRINMDCLMKNAGGHPTVLFTFDDNEDSTYDVAYPLMEPWGIKGSCYIARDLVGVSDGMSLVEMQTLYADGWDMACDGTIDDTSMTALADPAAAVTNINLNRTYLTDNGMPRAADHLCYPNGYFMGNSSGVIPTAVQVAAMTGTGTDGNVTFGSAATVTTGMKVYGKGVPAGTTVLSVTDTTHCTLSSTIPVGPVAAAFMDESGVFYKPALQTALAAAGYRTGRTTLGGTFYSRFGFSDQALVLPGQGVSGLTFAQMQAHVDQAILRGSTVIFYFHRVTEAGGSINVSIADFTSLVNYVGGKKRAGILTTKTLSEFWDRDSNGLASLPF